MKTSELRSLEWAIDLIVFAGGDLTRAFATLQDLRDEVGGSSPAELSSLVSAVDAFVASGPHLNRAFVTLRDLRAKVKGEHKAARKINRMGLKLVAAIPPGDDGRARTPGRTTQRARKGRGPKGGPE